MIWEEGSYFVHVELGIIPEYLDKILNGLLEGNMEL